MACVMMAGIALFLCSWVWSVFYLRRRYAQDRQTIQAHIRATACGHGCGCHDCESDRQQWERSYPGS
jgi:hypothetical protein